MTNKKFLNGLTKSTLVCVYWELRKDASRFAKDGKPKTRNRIMNVAQTIEDIIGAREEANQ